MSTLLQQLIELTGQLAMAAGRPPTRSGDARAGTAAGAAGRRRLRDRRRALRLAGLRDDAPLTAMAVEVHREPEFEQPLGRELGHARLLRASVLVAVPDAC